MTLKVTIQPMDVCDINRYPVYYAGEGGVEVLPSGALQLTSRWQVGWPAEFRIYAPGTWREINVKQVDNE